MNATNTSTKTSNKIMHYSKGKAEENSQKGAHFTTPD